MIKEPRVYSVYLDVKVDLDVTVVASSKLEAFEKAKKLANEYLLRDIIEVPPLGTAYTQNVSVTGIALGEGSRLDMFDSIPSDK